MHRIAACLLVFSALKCFGATYYVANTGNDSSNGTSVSSAWRTLAKVSSYSVSPGFAAGDTVCLIPGNTWHEQLTFGSTGVSATTQSLSVLGRSQLTGASATSAFASSGASGNPITIAACGGSGAAPVLDEADMVAGAWTLVSGTTYKIPYSGYPSKMFVDNLNGPSTAVWPALDYQGAFSTSATYPPYAVVMDSGSYYETLMPQGPESTFNSSATWFGLPWALPAAYQVSGLANVENKTQGVSLFWADGNYLYVNLADGSNPAGHSIEVTTRSYGVLLQNVNYVTVNGLQILHAAKSGILVNAYSAAGTQGNYISILNNTIYNTGDGSQDYIPSQNHTYGNTVQMESGITFAPYAGGSQMIGADVENNTIDTIDDTAWQLNYYHNAIGLESPVNAKIWNNTLIPVNAQAMFITQRGSAPCSGVDFEYNTVSNAQNGPRVFSCGNSIFAHNVVKNGYGFGFQIALPNSTFAYNTIYQLYASTRDTAPGVHGTIGVDYNGFDCNGGGNGIRLYNNTVYAVAADSFTLEGAGPLDHTTSCPNADIENNIFDASHDYDVNDNNSGGGVAYIKYESQPLANYSYNLSRGNPIRMRYEFDYKDANDGNVWETFTQFFDVIGGTGNFEADPKFTNPAAEDFSLTPDSPACAAGAVISALGQTRPPNIGSWQGGCISPL